MPRAESCRGRDCRTNSEGACPTCKGAGVIYPDPAMKTTPAAPLGAAAPSLWSCIDQREGGRPGEIDYLFQATGRIVPVELKSGTAGAMKSLHQFMFDKGLSLARLDENPPSVMKVDVKTTQGDRVRYRLLGLPIYLAFRAPELLASVPRR